MQHHHANRGEEVSTQQLKELILSKRYQMSLMQLDNPLKIKFLTFTPQIYINLIVTIPKLDFYIKNFWDSLTKGLNENGIQQLFSVYQRWLLTNDVQSEHQLLFTEHLLLFYDLVQHQEDSSPMVNEYIKFQLAAGRLNNNMNNWLPKFIMRFSNLDYQVLFYCASQFFKNPQNYEFLNESDKFILRIKQKFEQFLQKFEGSQQSSEVQKIKELILHIQLTFISNFPQNSGIPHEIHKNVYKYLIKSEQFNSEIFLFLKKYGLIGLFDQWVKLLIHLGEYSMVTFLVENLLYYYCTSAKQARIVKIIEENEDWAKGWAQGLSKNRVSLIAPMFMNDEYCFQILNKILIYFRFEGDESFLLMLDQIGYIDSVRKFGKQQSVRVSIIQLFREFLHQSENILQQMFQWDQNPEN